MQAHDVEFSNTHLKQLMETEIDQAKLYLTKFFYPHLGKIFYLNTKGGFELYAKAQAKGLISEDCEVTISVPNVNSKKFDKKYENARKWLEQSWFMKYDYTPKIKFAVPELTYTAQTMVRGVETPIHYLNMARPMNYSLNEKVANMEQAKKDIELVYEHVRGVWCSNNIAVYEYVLNWLACTMCAIKLRKALLLQSAERTGKGMILEFLHLILGDRMYRVNNSEEILTYTKNFEGRCLLNWDETDEAGNKKLENREKFQITEKTFDVRAMHQQPYQQDNTFNIINTTNNNAVFFHQNNKERWVPLDISEHRKGDSAYFIALQKAISSRDVQLLFYQQMYARCMDGQLWLKEKWDHDITPDTKTYKTKVIEALPYIYKYLKRNYLMENRDLNENQTKFLEIYSETTKNDNTGKYAIGRLLTKIGVETRKLSSNRGYNYVMSVVEMYKYFMKQNWIDDEIDKVPDALIEAVNKSIAENTTVVVKGVNIKPAKMKADDYGDILDETETKDDEPANEVVNMASLMNELEKLRKENEILRQKVVEHKPEIVVVAPVVAIPKPAVEQKPISQRIPWYDENGNFIKVKSYDDELKNDMTGTSQYIIPEAYLVARDAHKLKLEERKKLKLEELKKPNRPLIVMPKAPEPVVEVQPEQNDDQVIVEPVVEVQPEQNDDPVIVEYVADYSDEGFETLPTVDVGKQYQAKKKGTTTRKKNETTTRKKNTK